MVVDRQQGNVEQCGTVQNVCRGVVARICLLIAFGLICSMVGEIVPSGVEVRCMPRCLVDSVSLRPACACASSVLMQRAVDL
jgi:hypothetical protein